MNNLLKEKNRLEGMKSELTLRLEMVELQLSEIAKRIEQNSIPSKYSLEAEQVRAQSEKSIKEAGSLGRRDSIPPFEFPTTPIKGAMDNLPKTRRPANIGNVPIVPENCGE